MVAYWKEVNKSSHISDEKNGETHQQYSFFTRYMPWRQKFLSKKESALFL